MEISPDQLRAQRELVKRHLDWLDAQIEAAARAPGETLGTPAHNPVPVTFAPARDLGWRENDAASAPASAGETSAIPAEESHADVLLAAQADPSTGITTGAKLGCIAIAAFIALGFLFVLFVLPRFLYKKNGAQPAPQEQVRP